MNDIPEENDSKNANEEEENEEDGEGGEEDEEEEKEDKDEKEKASEKSKKSESKKSESKKSESKKSESKKSESKKSESKKSESKKSESKKSESKNSENQKSEKESKKSENQKSSNSKKIITVSQKNPKEPSQNDKKSSSKISSKKSNKITIDANSKNSKNSNLPMFNDFMKSDPNDEIKSPSIHFSDKYSRYSKNSKISKNSKLPSINEFMKSDPNVELHPPSIHYSEKYSKSSKKEEKKNSEKEEEEKEIVTFDKYLKDDPDMNLNFQIINYKRRYQDIDEEEEKEEKEEIKSNKSKSKNTINSKISKKSKVSSSIHMYQDFINGDPEKQYKIKDIDYKKRYGNISEISSQKSKKSLKKAFLGNVDPNRVITTEENEKENIPKLLCEICKQFPLEPTTCSECKCISCSVCLKDKPRCQKCNSIYKHVDLNEELNKLFQLCRIICKYMECGCKEQLTPNELSNHEENCKNTPITCENCNEKMTYEKYLPHYKECKLNTAECEICGYKDNVREFEKTNKKIEHIKHILIPEIEEIVKKHVEKAVADINESLDRREANKEPEDNKAEEEFRKKLLDIQQLLLNIQPKDFLDKKDDIGTMTKANYLDRKIKNIKLVKTLPSKIDNSFGCNNNYCVIHSFKNDNIILYPNLKYGINSYNLSTEKDITVLPKIFDSNINCMSNCSNEKKSLTYFAAASYDRTIRIYSVEDGFKKIKTYREIFDDYSIFSLDLYCSNNQLILLAANANLKQIKVLYPEESDESEKSLIKYLVHKNKILCLKHNPTNEEEFFFGTEDGVHLYNIFNLIGEGDDQNKSVEPEKEFIDKNEDKANHVCITFIEEDKNYFLEGDSIGIVRIWSIKDAELKKKIKRGILKYQISSLDSWSGRFIIGGTKDGKLVIFDIFDGIAFAEFGEHKEYVYCVKVSENWKYEKIITSSGFDGELKIWASIDG